MKPCKIVDYTVTRRTGLIFVLILLKMAKWKPFWLMLIAPYGSATYRMLVQINDGKS